MKYIITETQLRFLRESIPMSVKRRLSYDTMKPFIEKAEIFFPTLCDDFVDEFDYASAVINLAVDEFLTDDEGLTDSLGDDYDEVSESVIDIVKGWYGEHLFDVYRGTCPEEGDEI